MVVHIAKNNLILLTAIGILTTKSTYPASGGGQFFEECKKMEWQRSWNEIIIQNITPAMLEWENEFFGFPGKSPMRRWLAFIQAMTFVESSWNPECRYTEDFIDDTTGELCESDGLGQLSLGDANSYPELPNVSKIRTKEQLFDAEFNLKCSLEIADYLIRNGRELSEYWSSLDPDKNGKQTLDKMKEILGIHAH